MHREKVWRYVNALAARLADLREDGAKIVTANGCFDLLHVGHVRYLEEARKLGDFLVVLVNTDASMARIKPDRELIVPEQDRMELVAALEAVDFVAPLDDDTPVGVLDLIQPAVHTKGTDYDADALPEKEVVERHGGRIEIVGPPKDRSSSELRKKLNS